MYILQLLFCFPRTVCTKQLDMWTKQFRSNKLWSRRFR